MLGLQRGQAKPSPGQDRLTARGTSQTARNGGEISGVADGAEGGERVNRAGAGQWTGERRGRG